MGGYRSLGATKLNGKIQAFEIWADKAWIGDPVAVGAMLIELVQAIGMTPHGGVEIHEYDTPELPHIHGSFTARLSLRSFDAIQHLHESYVIYDNWPEMTPAYANLIVNSCKSFETVTVVRTIQSNANALKVSFHPPIRYDGILYKAA